MKAFAISKGYGVIVDDEDYDMCLQHKWYAHMGKGKGRKNGQPYARATIKGKKVYLHRFITGVQDDRHVDHDNHQTLDCRRKNLKVLPPDINLKKKSNSKKKDLVDMPPILAYIFDSEVREEAEAFAGAFDAQ